MIIKMVKMVRGGFTTHIEYCRDGKDFEIEVTPKEAIDGHELISKIAQVDPMIESYQGDTSCFYCGSFDGDPHNSDCLWLEAKKLSEPPAKENSE